MYHIGIRKQSCYFDKVCDREFNRKHIEVNLFSLQLFIHEKRLTVLSEKKKKHAKFVSRSWGSLIEVSRAIAVSIDRSRKLMVL